MLVVEGMDGSGKTTLVSTLQESLGWPLAPRRVSKDMHHMVDLSQATSDILLDGWQEKIFDRFPLISEAIYGPLINREAPGLYADLTWLGMSMDDFRRIQPLIVFCIPPFAVVEQNLVESYEEEGQPSEVLARAFELYWLYHYQAARTLDCFVYDYTAATAGDQLKHIVREARLRSKEMIG